MSEVTLHAIDQDDVRTPAAAATFVERWVDTQDGHAHPRLDAFLADLMGRFPPHPLPAVAGGLQVRSAEAAGAARRTGLRPQPPEAPAARASIFTGTAMLHRSIAPAL